jgi:hypothetical protein
VRQQQPRRRERGGVGDERACAVSERVRRIAHGVADHADENHDGIEEADRGDNADGGCERDGGVGRNERDEAEKQHAGVVEDDRAHEGAGGASALAAEKAGADRDRDEQQRHQRGRGGPEQDVKFVPAIKMGAF